MSSSYQQQSSQQGFRWHYSEFDDSNFQIRGRTLFFIVVLFTVILLVGLLFIYARWVCRFGNPPPPLPQLARCPPAPPKVNKLPVVMYGDVTEGGAGAGECCICLGIFGDGDKVKVMPNCKHCFHSECVDKWLLVHSSCPLCRGFVRIDCPV